MKYDRVRVDSKDKKQIIEELRRVGGVAEGRLTRHEFDRHSKYCKGSTIIKYFGSWQLALREAGMIQDFTRKPRRDRIPEKVLIAELVRIWKGIGHRPSKSEWEASDAIYSYTTYKERFGGWKNACKSAFAVIGIDSEPIETSSAKESINYEAIVKLKPDQTRNIPLKLRLKVFRRDDYKCQICGKSPAIRHGVVLHIDHIVPFAKGGKSILDNLRTLCSECNIGRGSDESV